MNKKPSELSTATIQSFKNILDIAVKNNTTTVDFTSIGGTWVGTPSSPITSLPIVLDKTGAVNGAVTAIYYKGSVFDNSDFSGGSIKIMSGANLDNELCIIWITYDLQNDVFIVNVQKSDYTEITTTSTTSTTSSTTTTSTTGAGGTTTTTTTIMSGLTTNLISVYELDETSGTNVVDAYGLNNFINSGALINQTGIIGTSYHFTPNNFLSNNDASLPFGFERTDSFSVSIWINKDTTTNNIFIGNMAHDSLYRGWQISGTDNVTFILRNSFATNNRILVSTSASSLGIGSWHHVVCTYDGTSLASGCHIYIDGVDMTLTVGTDALTATIIPTNNLTYIGCFANYDTFYTGYMDQLAIWGRELSLSDVLQLYNSGSGLSSISW